MNRRGVKFMQERMKRPWYKFYKNQTEFQAPEVSLYSILENTTKIYGERPAIIYDHIQITYDELKDRVDRLALAWKEMGAQKGERIGLMLENHPDYIISYYAALALGLIIVQINPMYTPRELLQIIEDSNVTYLVTDTSALQTVREVCELYSFRYIFVSQIKESMNVRKFLNLEELKNYPLSLRNPVPISAHNDVAVIQYTGGTTGNMKGAMLTHSNLVANLIQSRSLYGNTLQPGQEMVLTATPLYHVYAMTSAMNLGIYQGSTLLLVRNFKIENVLELIKEYQPTLFPGVPKMYTAFVHYQNVEKYGLHCFKTCTSGSAPLPIEIIKRFEKLTGVTIGEGFGLSEASPTTHRNPPLGKSKVGSIGIPLPGTDSKIVDESGIELPPHTVGELLIKGPQVMKGYWNREEETRQTLQNGWLHTGDLAIMDEEGYFYIVGRKKEMILVGGFNIYPQEVEGILYEYPDVKEAAVVGIPDEIKGEKVKAYVVPKNGQKINLEDLKQHCYQRLTRYKVPKEFEIRDSLPRNTVGKLLKRLLIKEEQDKAAQNMH
jgi:long-chain acyl-CoA synthetase